MATDTQTARRPTVDLTMHGVTGLNQQAGVLYEEPLRELSGLRWRQNLKEMLWSDPVVGAILFVVEMLVRQVSWEVEPAERGNREAEELAAFVRGALFQDMELTWQETLAETLSFLPWGWCLEEEVYKLRGGDVRDPTRHSRFNDGLVGWRKWAIRSQDTLYRWQFDTEGGVEAMIQLAPPEYRWHTIPLEKALLFRTTSRKANPEGYSILRNAYTSYYRKTHLERIEAIGIERDLAGLPTIGIPPNLLTATPTAAELTQLTALKDIIRNIRRDEQEGILYPLQYDEQGREVFKLQLLASPGQRQFDISRVIERYDRRIAMTTLTDFLLLGHEAVGSFALASSKTDIFAVALGAWLDLICEVINRTAISRLLAFNGKPAELAPRLTHGDVESLPLDELGTYIEKLAGAGMPLFPDEGLEAALRRAAKLPPKEEGGAAVAASEWSPEEEGDGDTGEGEGEENGRPKVFHLRGKHDQSSHGRPGGGGGGGGGGAVGPVLQEAAKAKAKVGDTVETAYGSGSVTQLLGASAVVAYGSGERRVLPRSRLQVVGTAAPAPPPKAPPPKAPPAAPVPAPTAPSPKRPPAKEAPISGPLGDRVRVEGARSAAVEAHLQAIAALPEPMRQQLATKGLAEVVVSSDKPARELAGREYRDVLSSGTNGVYLFGEKKVIVATSSQGSRSVSVATHEMAHAYDHLVRPSSGNTAVAAAIATHGQKVNPYISQVLGRDPKRAGPAEFFAETAAIALTGGRRAFEQRFDKPYTTFMFDKVFKGMTLQASEPLLYDAAAEEAPAAQPSTEDVADWECGTAQLLAVGAIEWAPLEAAEETDAEVEEGTKV